MSLRLLARSWLSGLLLAALAAGWALAQVPEMSGLERAGGHVKPPATVRSLVTEIARQPGGELARGVPSLSETLGHYRSRKPGESLQDVGRRLAPGDSAGIERVLAAEGITPERATAAQRSQAVSRLINVEYPLRDREAVSDLLNLLMVLAHSEEVRGRSGTSYIQAYQGLRRQVADGLKSAGGSPQIFHDGLEQGRLHSGHDLEITEPLVLGFRPALESLLAQVEPALAAAESLDLAARVEEARGLRQRRADLRELAMGAVKHFTYAQVLADRGREAEARNHLARAERLMARLEELLGEPAASPHAARDIAVLAELLHAQASDNLGLAAGVKTVLKRLSERFPKVSLESPAPQTSRERREAAREVDRLLELHERGPFLILIDVDGLRPDVLESLLAERGALGQETLPNIDRYIVRRGAFLRNHVTCFPSSTFPGTTTFLTGRYPSAHRIQSNTLFFEDVKQAQDGWSLSAARKKNWVNYLSPSQSKMAAEHVPKDVPYLFEMLGPSDLTYLPTSRGVQTRFSKSGFVLGMMGLFFEHHGSYVPFGQRGFDDLLATASYEMVNDGKRWKTGAQPFVPPRVMGHYYAWIDHASHGAVRGQFSGEVHRFLEYADRLLGRFLGMVEQLGILDDTVIVLISDHGHYAGPAERQEPGAPAPDGNVPYALSKRLEEQGFILRKEKEEFQTYDAVLITDGEGTARVHLPQSGGTRWGGRLSFDELKHYVRARDGVPLNMLESVFLVEGPDGKPSVNPAIDVGLMLGRDVPSAGLRECVVYTARKLPGQAAGSEATRTEERERRAEGEETSVQGAFSLIRRLQKDGKRSFRYLYRKGFDPLGYELTVPVVRDAGPAPVAGWRQTDYFDERDWLAMTMHTDYPDALFAIDDYFDGPDRAEIVLSARPGYCFDESAAARSDHGYLLAPSMRSTLVIAGPGIKRGVVSSEPHRSVDMIPTVLTAMGETKVLERTKLDGRVAEEILEEGFGR